MGAEYTNVDVDLRCYLDAILNWAARGLQHLEIKV